VVICIRVQEGAGMGVGPVEGGAAGLCLGRMRIDRLVEVRSNCDYSTLNCSHTLHTL
jgi:hypothetical protein